MANKYIINTYINVCIIVNNLLYERMLQLSINPQFMVCMVDILFRTLKRIELVIYNIHKVAINLRHDDPQTILEKRQETV